MQNPFFSVAIVLCSFLFACSDVSDVTDPGSREDIASWFRSDPSSSSITEASSSSGNSSSSLQTLSSSLSSSSMSSSSQSLSSSSSEAMPSSSSTEISSSSLGNLSSSSLTIAKDSVRDERDGKWYQIVKIGSQTWMAENLAYLPSGYTMSMDTSSIKPYYYVYGYMDFDVETAKGEPNYTQYGVLYNWTAAMNSTLTAGAQGVCPDGWHLPSQSDWDQLVVNTGGLADLGSALKASSSLWYENSKGTDQWGFAALPGGFFDGAKFAAINNEGYWWTSTREATSTKAYAWKMDITPEVSYSESDLGKGFSVRCVKD